MQLLLLSALALAADGITTTPATILAGENSEDRFGKVAGSGDLDGDGYDDVVVGAGGYEAGTGFGRVYAYLGSASGVSSSASQLLDGAANGTGYGDDVAVVGDVNDDGYDDVLVGAAAYARSTGQVYLYLGGVSGLSSAPDMTLTGGAEGDQFGGAVAGGADRCLRHSS